MSGGTPFAVVGIKGSEVAQRTTTWATVKRLFGFKVKSVLELMITPVESSLPVLADPSNKHSPETFQMTQLLPPNIVLPSSSVSVVAIYRYSSSSTSSSSSSSPPSPPFCALASLLPTSHCMGSQEAVDKDSPPASGHAGSHRAPVRHAALCGRGAQLLPEDSEGSRCSKSATALGAYIVHYCPFIHSFRYNCYEYLLSGSTRTWEGRKSGR